MTRFIDADALIESMTKFSNATGEDMTHAIFYTHIAPTIDAVPVKRGQWLKGDDETVSGECSVCGWEANYYETDVCGMPYCPNCGARMKGENNG